MIKKRITAALILGIAPSAFAGGVFYNSNQSAEYIRTFDRNAALDNADIVYYNMAGTVKLPEGLTFNLSNQSIFQWANVETEGNPVVGNRDYESNNPAWFVPNFYAAYRKSNWCVFAGLETIGATAIREWKGGLPTLDLAGLQAAGYGGAPSGIIGGDAYVDTLKALGVTPSTATPAQIYQAEQAAVAAGLSASNFHSDSYLKGSSAYLAFRFGGAYQIADWFSLAVAGRYVTSQQNMVGRVNYGCTYDHDGHDYTTDPNYNGRMLVDVTQKAHGFSGEIGMDFFPWEGGVINLTYESFTTLPFKTTVNDGKSGNGLYVNGSVANLDLPKTFRVGIGQQVTDRLRLSMSVNTYYESQADWSMLNNPANDNNYKKDYKNTREEGASLEYRISKAWLYSVGINFNQIGLQRDSTIDTSVPGAHSDYMSLGTGFQYTFKSHWKFNFGLSTTRFVHTYTNQDVEGDQALQNAFATEGVTIQPQKQYDKRYIVLGLGVEYHF
jgi:hypothetical protein